MSMSEQVKQTIALYSYIDESPYLSQSQAEKAREYARVGEWAISLEYICLCVASNLSKQNKLSIFLTPERFMLNVFSILSFFFAKV